jgi:SAM-dependent methyltransferase
MNLLDAGCGPGSITVGLAARVAPGLVTGVDIEASVLRQARALAAASGTVNLSFHQASAGALPFPDASFDAVFAHTLLEHVPDPAVVLAELRRVTRPGGVLGLRDCDWASGVFAPADPLVAEAVQLYDALWRHNGGQPDCGRWLRSWLHEGGWEQIETSATFRWDGSSAESRAYGELLADRFQVPSFTGPLVALGWSSPARLDEISAACRAWSMRQDAFAAMIMGEAVARRP